MLGHAICYWPKAKKEEKDSVMERPVNKKDKVEFNKEAQAGRRNTTRKAIL